MKDVPKAIEAVWKIESTRLIVAIARVTDDIGIAEELAQDALVIALELWTEEGIPENPGAWLMTAAKRRAIDSPKASSTTSRFSLHRSGYRRIIRSVISLDLRLRAVVYEHVSRSPGPPCYPIDVR
jgi:predicted RNA polymerase sigma factor